MRLIAIVLLLFAGCAPIETVNTTRLDGRPCRTTKVRPDFYTAETWTDCLDKNGDAVAVATNHADLSEYGLLTGAIIGALASH